jgi:hypothetical protein
MLLICLAIGLAIPFSRSKWQALTSCLLNFPEKASRHHDLPVIALCKLEALHLNIQAESAATTHLRPILGSCSEGPYLARERTLNHQEIIYLEDNTGTDAVNEILCFLSVIISQFFLHRSERLAKLTTLRFSLYGKGLKHMRQNSSSNLLEVNYRTIWRSAEWALDFLYIYPGFGYM